MSSDDFAFEPARGLPTVLPAGEKLLWQGAPSWRAVARRVFHVDKVAIYFGVMMAWRFFAALHDGAGLWSALQSGGRLFPLAVAAIVILSLFAWGVGRTTVYSITNRRVAMRIGMALPLTINVPFRLIENVDIKVNCDTTGDIALAYGSKARISFGVLWPHVRPFRLAKPQPMLRCLSEPQRVGDILAGALAASTVASQSAGAESRATAQPQTLAAAE